MIGCWLHTHREWNTHFLLFSVLLNWFRDIDDVYTLLFSFLRCIGLIDHNKDWLITIKIAFSAKTLCIKPDFDLHLMKLLCRIFKLRLLSPHLAQNTVYISRGILCHLQAVVHILLCSVTCCCVDFWGCLHYWRHPFWFHCTEQKPSPYPPPLPILVPLLNWTFRVALFS